MKLKAKILTFWYYKSRQIKFISKLFLSLRLILGQTGSILWNDLRCPSPFRLYYYKISQTSSLTNNRNVFLTVLEAGNPNLSASVVG